MASVNQSYTLLRKFIAGIIESLEVWTSLFDVCASLGLQTFENIQGLGKSKYLTEVMLRNPDRQILLAAEKVLNNYPGLRGKPSDTNLQVIQDAIWWIKSQGVQQISNVTRYRIVECLEGVCFWGRFDPWDFFKSAHLPAINCSSVGFREDGSIFHDRAAHTLAEILGPFSGVPSSTPPKWEKLSTLNFLIGNGLNDWPDERFCLFIERIVHPEVQKSEIQKKLVDEMNSFLHIDGFELRQVDTQGGLPIYRVQKSRIGVDGTPKYIIFASNGPKPDIVIADAVNMDVQIVHHADKCLIYDEPPPSGDLTWEMLVEWWCKKRSAKANTDIRRELGSRLQASLQSEPEHVLFSTYFKYLKPKYGSNLPALLPQVYLHYDPRNRNEREVPVLIRQRMDFLLLLKDAARIVIEIDGVQHYSDKEQRASPSLYAEMVAEDRRIKCLGYEVYRFGGAEFVDSDYARAIIIDFFEKLFARHGISSEE